MADTKITGLTAIVTPATGDILPIVTDPGGTPLNRKITRENFFKNLKDNITFDDDAVPTTRTIAVDDQTTADTDGNALIIRSGSANGTGTGGTLDILAGTAGGADGSGGTLTLKSGDGDDGGGNGGEVLITSGDGFDDGNSGQLDITSGFANGTGSGSNLNVYAGGSNLGNGGSLWLEAGASESGAGTGGNVNLRAGDSDSGTQSNIKLIQPDQTAAATLDIDLLTTDRTYTFPNATGTFVLHDATQTLTNKTLTSPVLTTPSAFTTGGTITLAENTSIALDPAGSADGKYTGLTISGTAGTTLAFGDLVYLAAVDSRWELADADAATTSGDVILGVCVLAAASDGNATTILLIGNIRADAAFPALTISAPAYVGTTAGDIQTAQPSGTDDVIRRVGFALTADELYFNPSNDYVTHT